MESEMVENQVECVRNFLCGYQFCVDMLQLRGYERKRKRTFDEESDQSDLQAGDELLWRSRMYEIQALVERMPNGKAKLILYYHYVRGESVQYAANMLGISRRTGYRWLQKGLRTAAVLYQKKKKTESDLLA